MNLFLIPGNPPAAYYYEEWMKAKLALNWMTRLGKTFGPKPFFKTKSALGLLVKEASKLTNEEIETSLRLIEHERNTIMKLKTVGVHTNDRMKLYYCENDTWCPKNTYIQLSGLIEIERVTASHDFVIKVKERGLMSKKILKDLV